MRIKERLGVRRLEPKGEILDTKTSLVATLGSYTALADIQLPESLELSSTDV